MWILGIEGLKRTRSKSIVAPHILAQKVQIMKQIFPKSCHESKMVASGLYLMTKKTITGKELIYKHQKENKAQGSSLMHPVQHRPPRGSKTVNQTSLATPCEKATEPDVGL